MFTTSPDRLFARFRRTGDGAALARVFDLLAPELVSIARHLVPDEAEAEDVVQATFVVAIEGKDTFDPERKVRPWLIGILARQAGLARREAGRRPEPERLPEKEAVDPASAAERTELRRAVQSALREVPAPYSQVLTLHLADGAKPEAIAQELGRRPGTVRVQLHRGLRMLRRALPASFAIGGVANAATPRGLASVKAAVIQHASVTPAAAVAGTSVAGTSIVAGGLTMAKAGWVAGAAAVLGGVMIVAWPDAEEGLKERAEAARPEVALAAPETARAFAPANTGSREREEVDTPRVVGAARDAGSEERPTPVDMAAAGATGGDLSVEGRVVDLQTRTPAPGARVIVWLSEDPTDHTNVQRRETTSSASGSFRVEELPFAPISVRIEAEGYSAYHRLPVHSEIMRAALAKDGHFDFGDLLIDRGVEVSGIVLDADGRAVSGAEVFSFMALRPELPRNKTSYGWKVARTEPDGTFALPERLYTTGGVPHDHGLMAITPAGLAWTRFAALAGESDQIEVTLKAVPPLALTVEVTGERGEPIEGARVTVDPDFDPFAFLHRLEQEFWHNSSAWMHGLLAGTTDAGGRLALAQVPRPAAGDDTEQVGARYAVEIQAPDGRRQIETLEPVTGTVAHLTVTMGREALVRVRGTIRDRDGRPLADAEISGAGEVARSVAGGGYELVAARPTDSALELEVSREGYGTEMRNVVLGEGGVLTEVDFTLGVRAPIRGVVVDAEGNPVVKSWVSVSRLEPGGGHGGGNRGTHTDQDGRFAFERTHEGRWRLTVTPPYGDAAFLGLATHIVDGGEEDARIVLKRAAEGIARVEVRVLERRTGHPLDPLAIHITPRREIGWASDHPVHYDIERIRGGAVLEKVRVGTWRVWATADGVVPGYADFEVESGEELVRVDIELGGTGAIEGRVDGFAGGAATGHVGAMLETADGTPSWGPWESDAKMHASLQLGGDGSFRLEGLLPGRYVVRFGGVGFVGRATATVQAGDTASVTIEAEEAGTVRARGRFPEGAGVVLVRLVSSERDWTTPAIFVEHEEDGSFEAPFWVPGGTWTWEAIFRRDADAEADQTLTGTIRVVPGTQSEVWIAL